MLLRLKILEQNGSETGRKRIKEHLSVIQEMGNEADRLSIAPKFKRAAQVIALIRHSLIPNPNMADQMSKFMEVYSVLKSDLLNGPVFEYSDQVRQWVGRMLDDKVHKGKLKLGLSIIDSYKMLKQGKEITDDELFLACVLGWQLEWFQEYLFIAYDLSHDTNSHCSEAFSSRLPKLGLLLMNSVVKEHNLRYISRILKKHLKGKPSYVDLLDLLNEAQFQTFNGQMIELIATLTEKDLSQFSLPLYHQIVEHETGYYLFYLPVAFALLMFGEEMDNHNYAKDILFEMAIYSQVQIGTDIEDFKCSWLVVKALELCNEDQMKTLYENYGKNDSICVAKVKELYNVLKLQDIYLDYKQSTYKKITNLIDAVPRKEVQAVLKSFLAKNTPAVWILHDILVHGVN